VASLPDGGFASGNSVLICRIVSPKIFEGVRVLYVDGSYFELRIGEIK
jgi:hypothetical protein